MASDFTELGVSGLQRTGGTITDEFLNSLRGTRGAKTWREMADNDPVVGAMLFAIERLILAIEWRVDPYPGDDQNERDIEVADFVNTCLHDMSQSWESTVSDILSMLVYGYAYCEIVYKKREGPAQTDPRRRSQHSDSRIGWRKIALRAQESTYDWVFDADGGLQGMNQLDPNGGGVIFIPIDRSLLFRTSTQRSNPEGRSLLRNAYRPWRFKKTIEEIEAVGIERDLAGLPVALVPPSLLSSNATGAEVATRAAIETLVRGIKRNENEGVLFPLAYDESGREMYKLTLLNAGGQRQFDTDKIVSRYDQRIAMTVLADFILLGHENVGSFALGASKIDLFATAIGQIANSIAQVFNQYAIPRLLKLNGEDTSRLPEMAFGDLTHIDLGVLGGFIQQVAGVGALVIDESLDEHLRQIAGLPPRSEEDGVPAAPPQPPGQQSAEVEEEPEDEMEEPEDEVKD